MPAEAPLSVSEFFESVRDGRLVVQRCAACSALAVPPRAICPGCQARTWERTSLGGDGEVASFTVIRVPPGRLAAQAPYTVAIVRMVEGVSLLGRMVGVAPEGVSVGLPVRFAGPADSAAEPPVITFRPR